MNDTTTDFYNLFRKRLLLDFLESNPRTESAIRFASARLREQGSRSVLDLGCGIGWSSHEFKRQIRDARVQGLDLSPQLIEMASIMFPYAGLHYSRADLTSDSWCESHRHSFDACVMIDVYEHIPLSARPAFHAALDAILSDSAILLLTCPSIRNQHRSRELDPSSMQPVDEDVGLRELESLAGDIGGEVMLFDCVSIWEPCDYFHAVIARGDRYPPRASICERDIRLSGQASRRQAAQRVIKLLDPNESTEVVPLLRSWPQRMLRRHRSALQHLAAKLSAPRRGTS